MKRLIFVFCIAGICFGQANGGAGSWQKLFDGRSLDGWEPQAGAKWNAASGVLTSAAGADGWLRSTRTFGNFELRLEFRNAPKGNSGVFLRATPATNTGDPSNPAGGYELQINNEDPQWATGSIESYIQRLKPVNPAANKWHKYEVNVRGDHLLAKLDGVTVLDGHDSKFRDGHIGLQHHQGNRIEFRNIEIRPFRDSAPLSRISIPGDYGWDYLTADSEGRRLYVSHDREVVVVNLDTGAIIGSIPGKSVHGIAIARELGRGFISSGQPGSVIVFDLATLRVLQEVPVGADPNVILYDPETHRVFTADRGSKKVSVIDGKTGMVVATVEGLGGKTEHAALDSGHLYLNMQDLNKVLKIDTQTMKVTDTWTVAPCEQPSSMDIDRAHARIFIGCRSGVMTVLDTASGKIVTTQPIGKGVDATEFDAPRGLIYFACGEGKMWVFHEDDLNHYSLVDTTQTQASARTVAVDQKTGTAYLSVAEYEAPPTAGSRGAMKAGSFSVLIVRR